MKKLPVIAAFLLVALVMVSVWIGSRDLKVADSPDRNVPGATHREREELFGSAVIKITQFSMLGQNEL
jgi:hypothetical protein